MSHDHNSVSVSDESLAVPLSEGDIIDMEEDGRRTAYEYVNATDTGLVILKILEAESDGDRVGTREWVPRAEFLGRIRDADRVEMELS